MVFVLLLGAHDDDVVACYIMVLVCIVYIERRISPCDLLLLLFRLFLLLLILMMIVISS